MLSIERVSYRYPGAGQAALGEVTLNIPAGGVYGLLGPNGAGKTTLISLLCGVLTADQGRIMLEGVPLSEQRARDPRSLALVPQEYAFYPMLTVRENLDFFAGILDLPAALARRRIDEALAFARLEQVAGRTAETLSGGLKRRLNLAIGLLGEPRLLLLDEPTVGVDPQSRLFLLNSIAGLAANGTTVIYTSHYMEEIESICARIAILDQGRVLAEGALADLLADDEGCVELTLADRMPDVLIDAYGAEQTGACRYRLKPMSTAELPRLLAELADSGCRVREIHAGRMNLEQLFMQLTRRSLRD